MERTQNIKYVKALNILMKKYVGLHIIHAKGHTFTRYPISEAGTETSDL